MTARAAGSSSWQRRLTVSLDRVDSALCVVLVIALAAMLAAALVQVGARYLTTATVIGPEEIARYMMVGSTFLAIPVLARRRNHIAVDALAHLMPGPAAKRWLNRLLLALELSFLVILTKLAWDTFRTSWDSGQASIGLGVPLAWPLLTVFVGALIGAFVTLGLLVESFLPAAAADEELEITHYETQGI